MLLSEHLASTMRTKPEKVRVEKLRISSPKSALLQIASRLDEISPRDAGKLRTIVAKLEDFQNGL